MSTLTIDQPSPRPTRKVTVAAVVAIVVNVAAAIVEASATVTLPAWLMGPATAIAAIGAAYLARERVL